MYEKFSLKVNQLAAIRGERLLYKQLDLSLTNGSLLQIKGENGAGKTTLLRALCLLNEPDAGELSLNNCPANEDTSSYQQHILYIGHQLGIKQRLTVTENLAFYRQLRSHQLDTSIDEAIDEVGLSGYEQVFSAMLSQGQKRRISMARLLLEAAPIWVLDEPFVALDVDGQAWLSDKIAQHIQRGGACVFTSHQAVQLSSDLQVLELGKGK
ncbi:MAG: cytochrome c biogenesis heme-transporting ATPase CcmA [Kangiellaceae bacterium]|jgi:heme exporter protein A|nr:cytochrome c biogenesis heme-transporting ATPase CcmA [Kangiellaceae bacterium]